MKVEYMHSTVSTLSQIITSMINLETLRLGPEHPSRLLRTDVRWLYRGKIMEQVFELREEFLVFLQPLNSALALLVADEIWLGKLAYLADIFDLLNQLNLSLQDRDVTILHSQTKHSINIKLEI